MLAELFLQVVTRVPGPLRRLGLLRESIGLWSRARRQRRAWQPHYERCHVVAGQAVSGLARRRSVLVLGSGLVRDVPIEALARDFGSVILVDAVHLPVVRRRLRHLPNIEWITRDLSGLAAWLEGGASGRADPLADLRARDDIDLVISANLLSQLPIALLDWLARHPRRAAELPPDIAGRAVGWHLEDLARFRCRVCLLTDVEMREEDRTGQVTDRLDLLRGHALPETAESWDWAVAPFGEASRSHRYVHHVRAYADFHRETGPAQPSTSSASISSGSKL